MYLNLYNSLKYTICDIIGIIDKPYPSNYYNTYYDTGIILIIILICIDIEIYRFYLYTSKIYIFANNYYYKN